MRLTANIPPPEGHKHDKSANARHSSGLPRNARSYWQAIFPCSQRREEPMPNLNVTEIKAFVPARDFTLSKQFYQDLGFTLASDGDGVAYFHLGNASFLLQDGNPPGLAEQLMMHLLVEDVAAWQAQVEASQVAARYGVRVTELVTQPWRMKEFCLYDPAGVLWRIAQNID